MGLFGNLFKKMFYVVDKPILKQYLEKELEFSINEHLDASANLYLYLNSTKNHLQIWNYTDSIDENLRYKGIVVYYNESEFKSIDELFLNALNNLPEYFKIELIDMDNAFLNQYRSAHPELKIEDYN